MTKSIDELVKLANNKTSWKKRLEALRQISEIDCQQRKDVVIRLAIHDKVFAVKSEACQIATKLGLTKNGKPIRLGKKNIGYKNSDFTKAFKRVKRESKMEDFDLEVFKSKFMVTNPEMYDVMSYEKKDGFDKWVENIYRQLPAN